MRTVVAQDVVSASKFNRFHLLVFIWCFYAIGFDGYDIAMYGVGLPWMMGEWKLSPLQAGAETQDDRRDFGEAAPWPRGDTSTLGVLGLRGEIRRD